MFKKFSIYIMTFCITAASLSATENLTARELSTVLKEVIEAPLSTEDVKVKFDVLDYELRENHIANMGVFFDVDCPIVNLTGEVNARHPKLGSVYGPFEGMDKDVVLIGQFEVEMRNPFLKELTGISDEFGSIDEIGIMRPFTKEMWENIVLKGIEEANSQKKDVFSETGVLLEPRIVRKNAEGLIESFAVVVKNPGKVKGSSPSEYEFIFTLKNTKLDIKVVQIDPTMSSCIFDDEEQAMMLTFENLRRRDPATMVYAQSIVQLIKSYFQMLSSMPPAMMQTAQAVDQVNASKWETFDPARLKQLQQQGKVVFVEYGAKWCLMSSMNSQVLDSPKVLKAMEAYGVVKMKADWTKQDPVITKQLEKHGKKMVPLYVLYLPDSNKPDVILPENLKPEVVIDYLQTHLSSK